MKESDQIDRIAQYLSGNLTEKEREMFLRWTKESEENQILFDETQKLWELSEQYEAPQFETDVIAAWDQVESRLETSPKIKSIRSVSVYRQLLRIAAVFFLTVLAAWWLLQPSEPTAPQMALIQTEAAEVKEFLLPDGSQVWLNGNSELTYDPKFDQRQVTLRGEAFFDVARMEEKPFEIFSGQAKTMVLGTAFNVRAYPEEDEVEVTVVRGKVALVENDRPEKAVFLEAGNAGSYSKIQKEIKKETQNNVNADSWKTEQLVFDNTPISEVIENLERYFKITIETDNPALLKCHFTGSYSQPELQQILDVLAFGVDLIIKKSGNNYLLQGPGCE